MILPEEKFIELAHIKDFNLFCLVSFGLAVNKITTEKKQNIFLSELNILVSENILD